MEGYELLQFLGQGSTGVVYKARQRGLKRLVTLKMIRSEAHAGEDALARFRTEAEAVTRLQHPNIVQIYEIGEWWPESGGTALRDLSLEYVEGGSLAAHIKGVPQSPRFAAELVRALAEAMQYAHDHKVIHRDLKPANILIRKEEGGRMKDEPNHSFSGSLHLSSCRIHPLISDFGLAKQLDDHSGLTVSGTIVGTPTYMAPEQAAGHDKSIGPSVDIYARGVILYVMLTGRPPFRGTTVFETLELVRHQEPVPPRRLQP